MVTSRKDGARRRDEILDAALACFAKRGVLAVGIEEIRKAAGASPSSMYHLFAGIADIVVALVERIARAQYATLAAAANAAETPEAMVRGVVAAQVAWTFAHAREARFMYQAFAAEVAGPDRKRLEEVKHAHRAGFDAAIAPWLTGTPLATWSSLELGVLFLGAVHQACRLHLAGNAVDAAWMRDELPTLVWRGAERYLAPTPARRMRAKRGAAARRRAR